MINENELLKIKDMLLYSVVVSILDRDIKVIAASPIKIKQPYIDYFNRLIDRINADIARTRHDLKENGIRIYDEQQTEKYLICKFECRGNHDDFRMLWEFVRAEATKMLKRYLAKGILN